MGYIDVWEHYKGGQHIDADWSPIFEDLYSPKLGDYYQKVLFCRPNYNGFKHL